MDDTAKENILFTELGDSFEQYCNLITSQNISDLKTLLEKLFQDNNLEDIIVKYDTFTASNTPLFLYENLDLQIIVGSPSTKVSTSLLDSVISFLQRFSIKTSSFFDRDASYYNKTYSFKLSLNTISLMVSLLRSTLFSDPKS